MANHWSVDLRHFLLPNGQVAPLPRPAERLFAYWTEIVSQATRYDDPTTLLCRRRPGRRPCGTLLTIFFDADNNDVLWFCPRCHDDGRITGWENSDLEPEKLS
jgi:hypothetical protein